MQYNLPGNLQERFISRQFNENEVNVYVMKLLINVRLKDREAVLDLSQKLFTDQNFKYRKWKEFSGLLKIVSPRFHLHA